MTIKFTKKKERPLTAAQANLLALFCRLPKRYRHRELVGGWLPWTFFDSYDGRTVQSLRDRGLLEVSEYGMRVRIRQ